MFPLGKPHILAKGDRLYFRHTSPLRGVSFSRRDCTIDIGARLSLDVLWHFSTFFGCESNCLQPYDFSPVLAQIILNSLKV
jgi:hypothetical protein